MKNHSAGALSELNDLLGAHAAVDHSEQKILEAAEGRMEKVRYEMHLIRPRVFLNPSAGQRYTTLMRELGDLLKVINRSRTTVGK